MVLGLAVSATSACAEPPELHRIVPPSEWTWIPSWSADGRYVAVLWPAPPIIGKNGKIERVIGNSKVNTDVIAMPTPPTISVSSKAPPRLLGNFDQQKILLLKSNTFECFGSIESPMRNATWSPNGKLIAGGDAISIYNALGGKPIASIAHTKEDGFLDSFLWSPNSKAIATAQRKGVFIWDAYSGKKIQSVPESSGYRTLIAWSPDGRSIAVCGGKPATQLRVWSIGEHTFKLSVNAKHPIGSISWSKDGTWFAYSDQSVHILRADSMQEVTELKPKGTASIVTFAWSPKGSRLAYKGATPDLHVFDVKSMKEQTVLSAEKTGRFVFFWSPDSRYLAIQDRINQLAICDATTGDYVGAKLFDEADATSFTPDGTALCIPNFTWNSVSLIAVNLTEKKLAFEDGTPGNPWKDQKVLRNLDDCFEELLKIFPPSELESFKNTKEKELFLYSGGPGLGMRLRNTWGLREQTPLVEYFNKFGITDGADMSTLIINTFWRKVNNLPINIEEQVKTLNDF